MEDNEYKNLMEYFGKQFDRIDEQFAEMRRDFANKDDLKKELENFATKDDLKSFATKDDLDRGLDDVKRHNEILIEDVKHGIQAIVDGQRMHDEKQDRDNAEIADRFARLDKFDMHLMSDIDDHEMRIKALEKKS
ncbi:MAG: hypothetical protein HZC51_03340 [Nitrospirae bacterium]|nr:hypothetical protein [Nitrospirota bacterium]